MRPGHPTEGQCGLCPLKDGSGKAIGPSDREHKHARLLLPTADSPGKTCTVDLRTGCVEILDDDLRGRIERRAWIDEAEEEEIRASCFAAIQSLVDLSGLTQAAVDGFFFSNARKVCVEVEDAQCDECVAAHACAQRTTLFQPVIRTTAY